MKPEILLRDVLHDTIQQSDHGDITSIAIDSRKVEKGGVFVCLRGLQVDGHRFIEDVAKRGASAIVIDRIQESYPSGLTIWKVDDARKNLAQIAANFYNRPAEKMRLFGVTGTNGKTSTTYMLEAILKQAGKPGLIGTIGARFNEESIDIPFETSTTPDPPELHQIFAYMLKNGGADVAMEVSSHSLALHKMEGLHFEAGLFTNLTQDHLDFHGTMENYLMAKAKLFQQSRYGVVNADDQYTPRIMEIGTCEKWLTYGIDSECDLRAIHIEYLPEGSSFKVEINGTLESFYLPMKGKFSIYNSLATIGAAIIAGLSPAQIRCGLENFKGVHGRIQSIKNDKGFNVVVDYAHSPDGLSNIIEAVRGFTTGKVFTLFGCGGDKDTEKRPIMGRIAGELSDYCIVTSDNPRSESPEEIIRQIIGGLSKTNCPFDNMPDRREAIFHGISLLQPGDSLIIAGKGHENYQIIGDKTLPFDDVAVATEALQ